MKILFADSGSTKTHWALVEEVPGLPKMIRTAQTQGLNPLYVTPEQITSACRQALADVGEGATGVDELRFYGSGCSGERIAVVERALRAVFTPMTKVIVDSDLMGAALALKTKGEKTPAEPFIACIMGTTQRLERCSLCQRLAMCLVMREVGPGLDDICLAIISSSRCLRRHVRHLRTILV